MSDKSLNVLYSERAENDLDDIARWVYEWTYSVDSVDRVISRIENYISHLSRNPKLGVAGIVDGTREIYPKSYRVVYEVVDDTVRIITIKHCSQDYP